MASGNGLDDIFAFLESMNSELVSQGERLTALERNRATTTGGRTAEPAAERVPGSAVCWHALGERERSALWPEFVRWVVWAADRYELTNDQLPRACWWQHGAVVEELTALWTSHRSAYSGDEDAGAAPYLWQDALARAIERIGRLWIGTCRNGHHRDRHRQTWAGDEPYLNGLLAAGPQQTVET
ncbi:hypothetical protein [Streptomyces sp. B6B3]|uniref:hypothetical protein n=1 Tax=Streptomyces sp. B6B3 TaxID=3153570 RepID=UPI00325C49A9